MKQQHFWRVGDCCQIMTKHEMDAYLFAREDGFGLWLSDKYSKHKILGFLPCEYKHLGKFGKLVTAGYDAFALVRLIDGTLLEVPYISLKLISKGEYEQMVAKQNEGQSRKIVSLKEFPCDNEDNVEDIVELEVNTNSDIEETVCNNIHMHWIVKYIEEVKDSIDKLEHHLAELNKEVEKLNKK